MSQPVSPRWAELLAEAVSRPGLILEAYRRFHGYSLGNQLAASVQCLVRHIPPGPIATLQRWNELNRSVRQGEKALVLCMPVSVRVKDDDAQAPRLIGDRPRLKTIFVWKPRWFVLAQTEGEALPPEPTIPTWDATRALAELSVQQIPFDHPDGNVQGFARDRTVAVSPLAQLPAKTLFHELGHILLGHTDHQADSLTLPKTLKEAEAVALLCIEALGLPGSEYARGYIQTWHGCRTPIPEHSAQRIFRAADTILRAGRGGVARAAARA